MAKTIEFTINEEGRIFIPSILQRLLNLAPGMQFALEVDEQGQLFLDRITETYQQPDWTTLSDLEKRSWLRQQYIQILVDQGLNGDKLDDALKSIAQVDQRLQEDDQFVAELEKQSQVQFQKWAIKHGLETHNLTDEERYQLIAKGIQRVRDR